MPELLNIEVQLEPRVRNISVDVESRLQDIEVGICSSFIYAFSPTAKVEKIENGNYLITITDKNGTTTAEVPVVDQETIDGYIEYYLEHNPIIIQQLIKEAEDYQELYIELKQLIQNAIDVSVPAEPDGSININGTNYQVYELPEEVVTTDDFLIIDCLDAGAETSGDPGDSVPQQTTDKTGNGIDNVIFNDDYTLTIVFTDGTTYTTPPIRGAKGDTGNGISNITLNNDSTLTFTLTDGSSYTTASVKGLKGDAGRGILNTTFNNDDTLTITLTDGTSYTSKPLRGPKGNQGNTGNGIANTTLNNDYTLTISFTDGSSYTTPSIRGLKGDTGQRGPQGQKGQKGDPGQRGYQGPQGQKGDKGDTGQAGPQGIQGPAGPQGVKGDRGQTGNGIASAVLNDDYTLTLSYTDGTSFTTPSIRGEQGATYELTQGDKEEIADIVDDMNITHRVISLTSTKLSSEEIIETIGIPVYVSDITQYETYNITETGWYIFARITAPESISDLQEIEVSGAAGYIVSVPEKYIDVAVCFGVAASSQIITVNWGNVEESFVFKATDLAVRNLDRLTTFYVYDIAPYTTWEYVLTSDSTFVEGKHYYILDNEEYVLAEVTTGQTVPESMYYVHSKVRFEGMVRNVTYRCDTLIDCPMEFVLPEVEDETHGCWFEIRCRHAGAYSMTLIPPTSDIKIATQHTQKETAGINMINLHYTVVDGVKIWRFMNTHSSIPA